MSRQVLTTRTTRSVPVVYPQDIKILRLYKMTTMFIMIIGFLLLED